ncbi:MAG: D-alanyl-D-alanine carboxypeptidase family protein, partial [Dehalococcoidia bacterium]
MYEPTRRRVEIAPLIFGALFLLLIAFVVLQTLRPLPAISATTTVAPQTVLGNPVKPQMPTAGGSNVAVTGLGVVGIAGSEGSRPIASVTKMMTAYVILKSKPLQPNEPGPTITITAADQSRYVQMLNQDQSVLPVSTGQKFTELEMLQGMLVPSANNFAEILATWEAGSVGAFVDKMNAAARELGMTNTIYSDVSGFSSGSTSSPSDQLILARAAMANPVFSQIVAMESVRLPGIGLVSTTNETLGKDGVVGIKTGFTETAGGNLAFAARRQAGGQNIEIIGMVFGMTDKPAAFAATRNIINSVAQNVQLVQVMKKDQPVATIETSWGGEVNVIATEDVSMLLWPGMTLQAELILDPVVAPSKAGTQAGTLNLRLGDQIKQMPVVLADGIEKPGLFWRLG